MNPLRVLRIFQEPQVSIAHFSVALVLIAAAMQTLRADDDTDRKSSLIVADRERLAIASLFSGLSMAASRDDKNLLISYFIPSLRREVTEGTERDLGGELGVIRNVYEPWRSAVARQDIVELACSFEILAFRAYNLKDARLWEVCIEFTSEIRQWTGIWYFVEDGDGLLIAEWPYGGNPGRSIKSFDLSRPEQEWR